MILLFLCCAFCLCSCGEDVITIETPYFPLTVPGEFDGNVSYQIINENPYTISFSASDGTALFSLHFGEKTDNLIGTVPGETENIVLYATFADLDETSSRYDVYCRYQNGINTIIDYLVDDQGLLINEILEFDDGSTFEIQTSLTTLHYPNKWKDLVTVDVSDGMVQFSYKGEKLYDLVFSVCDGTLLGTYSGTPIYIVSYTVDSTKYSEDENYTISALCHDVNVILSHLMEDPNFSVE